MMEPMRRVSFLLFCFAAAFGSLPSAAADLTGVRSVYILRMPRGMDQYLANRLTNDHIFQVVTDPKRADAMLTDQIGEMFEEQLEALLPSPEPVKKVAPPPANDKDKPAGPLLPIDTETKLPPVRSTFGSSKGTLVPGGPEVAPGAVVGVRSTESLGLEGNGPHRLRYCKSPQEGSEYEEVAGPR